MQFKVVLLITILTQRLTISHHSDQSGKRPYPTRLSLEPSPPTLSEVWIQGELQDLRYE